MEMIEMYDYINSKLDSLQDLLDDVIGYSPFPISINSDPNDKDSPKISRSNESSLCNLAADAFKKTGDSDIALINAGSVRANLKEGNITYQNVLDLMPYSNDINVIKIKGQDILDALEWGVKDLPVLSAKFPQVSGLTYKIDKSINSIDEHPLNILLIDSTLLKLLLPKNTFFKEEHPSNIESK